MRHNTGKDPSFQFYWKDWLSDTKLISATSGMKGTWIDLMCISMDMPVRGVFHDGQRPLSESDLALMLPGDREEVKGNISSLVGRGICKVMPDGPFAGCLYVKRLYEDMRLREIRRESGKMGGNPVLLNQFVNQKSTPSSSSSSSSSSYPPTPQEGACAGDVLFDRFWASYPRKVAKDAARNAFAKRKPSEALLAKMLAAIEAQTRTTAWKREGGRYIPHPATWLNQGRWEDVVGPRDAGAPANREIVHKCYICGKQRRESLMRQHPTLTWEHICKEHAQP